MVLVPVVSELEMAESLLLAGWLRKGDKWRAPHCLCEEPLRQAWQSFKRGKRCAAPLVRSVGCCGVR